MIAIYDSEGNLIGKWQVDENDDLDLMLDHETRPDRGRHARGTRLENQALGRSMTVDAAQLSSTIKDHIDALLPELIEFRHDLHRHPEIMYEEHRTSGRIREELERAEIDFKGDLAGGTGVLAHLPGDASQAVGLRADIDALPIHEQSGVPHSSTIDGRMHACGHDGHTTILLGAARVLKAISREQTLPRPVSFLFQPAEEGAPAVNEWSRMDASRAV